MKQQKKQQKKQYKKPPVSGLVAFD